MLRIHFIDDTTGQPLCSTPESDRWLWTINPQAVTCGECEKQLASGRRAGDGAGTQSGATGSASSPGAESAIRSA